MLKLPARFFCLGLVCLLNKPATGQEIDSFVWYADNPDPNFEVAYTITADGISSISVGEREVATGGWRFTDAGWLFGAKAKNDELVSKTLERISPNHARVQHVFAETTVAFDYRFDGEDVSIAARVANFGDEELAAVQFSGLEFNLGEGHDGYRMTWPSGSLRSMAQNLRGFHPSFENLVGGSYAADGFFGVGLSPLRTGLSRTLFWWTPDGTKPHYLVPQAVPPGGALSFHMKMRVSREKDWRHLMQPYKEHFTSTFGPVKYKADHRPMAQYVAISNRHGGPGTDNPYGWSWWRLDTVEGGERGGMQAFAENAVSLAKQATGQGIIVWGLTGWSQRGYNYRPDFDVFPPEVERTLPVFQAAFAEAGLKMGALARPSDIVSPVTWETDGRIRLHPDQPMQLAMQTNRFKKMIEQGFVLYYLDVFGHDFNDIKSMRHFREEIGPDVLTFSEYWTDVTLVYSGGYIELDWNTDAHRYKDFWGHRWRAWEICHWLIPGVQAVAHTRRLHRVELPEGTPTPNRFLYQNGITPMFLIGTSSAAPNAEELKALANEFLDANGRFRK